VLKKLNNALEKRHKPIETAHVLVNVLTIAILLESESKLILTGPGDVDVPALVNKLA
jgi:hypothetical protein